VCRKNYGCTHFIIGRDHAGVNRPDGSSYYGSYDAQTFFARYRPEELGIQLFKFENTFFDRRSGGMCSLKTAPEGNEPVSVSGTKMRDMLKNGLVPPPEVTRPEVAQILIEHMRNPQN
jgi:sulfate adenylyltransferase